MSDSSLTSIDSFSFPVYASVGADDRAMSVGARAASALAWLSDALGSQPTPTVFVVDSADWPRVASIPLYGMPHASGDKVVVGTDPAPFWNEIVDWFWPHLATATQQRLRDIYGDPVDLASSFPDLVVVHELSHLYHDFDEATGESDFPRLWLAELFANLGLHGYLAEVEPEQLPVLETICSAASELPPEATPVRALDDMGRSFEFDNGAALYCWFEFVLLVGAKHIWESGGPQTFRDFHQHLRVPGLSNGQIVDGLERIHSEAARVMRDWPTVV